MAKEYTYTLSNTGKVLYRGVEANYVSRDTVDKKVVTKTGRDPRLERHLIECTIRVVEEGVSTKTGRYDKNKRTQY